MRIFIVADIEGSVGIYKRSQCFFLKPDHKYGMHCLTEDVNAVIRGAFEAGADSIFVRDTHEMRQNIIVENLPEGVEYISGQMEQQSFPIIGDPTGSDMVFLVASHARSGCKDGFFAHTFFGGFSEVRVDGNPVGEAFVYGAALSELGIPIGFNSGDAAAIQESIAKMPWMKTVVVPKEEEYYAACDAEERIAALREQLRLKASEAVKDKQTMRCLELPANPEWEVDFKIPEIAKKVILEGTALSGNTLKWTSKTYIEGFDILFKLVQASFKAYSS
jgi:D-amino peptidase